MLFGTWQMTKQSGLLLYLPGSCDSFIHLNLNLCVDIKNNNNNNNNNTELQIELLTGGFVQATYFVYTFLGTENYGCKKVLEQ